MTDAATRAQYPAWATETIRYCDTDRQGHVNNAVFATLLETGRVAFLINRDRPILAAGAQFVIARLVIDFKAELNWPGTADVGTGVVKVGRSSFTLQQAIWQGCMCAAVAETVIVQMDEATRKSTTLSPAALERLAELAMPGSPAN